MNALHTNFHEIQAHCTVKATFTAIINHSIPQSSKNVRSRKILQISRASSIAIDFHRKIITNALLSPFVLKYFCLLAIKVQENIQPWPFCANLRRFPDKIPIVCGIYGVCEASYQMSALSATFLSYSD